MRISYLRFAVLLFLVGSLSLAASAQSARSGKRRPVSDAAELRTERAFDAARANPLELHAFLVEMPKGADLHYHLTGGVYAETWLRDGAEDHLCISTAKVAFEKSESPACADGEVPAAQTLKDQHLYDALIDSFSMRAFVPSTGISGHDHFFDAFGRFGAVNPAHIGEWLDEIATRANAQNEQYLELMVTPGFAHTVALARELGWHDDENFANFRDELLAHGLRDDLAVARDYVEGGLRERSQRERCGTPDAQPACKVEIRFLYQVLRNNPPAQVFAQTLLGFEVVSADPQFVGINYVQPEDAFFSMRDYALHMKIVGFFHRLYPNVHISLHAGELAPGLVPPDGLCCHIRLAVEEAHAERIGHGVDVMYENHPYALLREMAVRHVMVEINLTSNDVILGITGKDHPFPLYRKFGVPVALSTDDEGVSRIDLTHEYVRAVETYGLTYEDLKQMVRTSLEHSFLPGASLWREEDRFRQPAAACSSDTLGAPKPSARCSAFLASNERARQQWELERRFTSFEHSF